MAGFFLVLSAGAAVAAEPKKEKPADDPYAALEMLIGTWTVAGSEATYRETCSWAKNRKFVVCEATDTVDGSSMSVFGWSALEKTYTYSGFSATGTQRTLKAWISDAGWTFVGGREKDGEHTRWQVSMTPNDKGFLFRQDSSKNGAAWVKDVEFQYLRVVEPKKK